MGKSTPSAPQAADPSKVAGQQTTSNVNTAVANAYLNNVNQNTPYGSLNYDVTGHQDVGGNDVPTFTANQTLSPAGQKLQDTNMSTTQGTADLANQYVKRIGDATSQSYSYDSLGPAPVYNAQSADKATQTLIDRNQPQIDRDRANLEQRLANQGIQVGTPAYQAAMDQYGKSVNDFRLGAESQGQTYAANDFNTQNTGYDDAIQRMTNLRTQPINEVSALLGTGTGVQQPNFVNTPQSQVAPTDVTGAYNSAYQQQQQSYNTQMQSNAATTGGLFGLGGTVLGAGLRYGLPLAMAGSDIRMKDNIRHIGHTRDGQNLYFFTYKSDPATPHIGLMAQEVEQRDPGAVVEIGGMKHVDYGRALVHA